MRLVLDSPPLQALHRCGVLSVLAAAYGEIAVPSEVVAETRRSREHVGDAKVPDLAQHPWLTIVEVTDDELTAAGAQLLKAHRATSRFRMGERQVDRPELEVVLVARARAARAVLEDKKGVLCAADAGVAVVGTAELLCDLELRGHVTDAVALAAAVMATGYHTPDLRLLASGSRREPWKTPLR